MGRLGRRHCPKPPPPAMGLPVFNRPSERSWGKMGGEMGQMLPLPLLQIEMQFHQRNYAIGYRLLLPFR